MRASSWAVAWVCVAPVAVESAACATPPMVAAMSAALVAASLTLRDISLVVAVCSSTAAAIVEV